MLARTRRRALLGLAAATTVTGLLGSTLSIPANAAPNAGTSKIKLGDAANQARVIKGRYLVETVGTPLIRGGNSLTNRITTAATQSAVRSVGAKVGESYSDLWTGMTVTASDSQIKKLAQSANVKAIYPVLRVDLPRTTASKTAASSELAAVAASGNVIANRTGKGIKVGVIDTGIDYNNPDLGGSGVNDQTKDFGSKAPRVKYGYDFVGDDYNPEVDGAVPRADKYPDDCDGHGTHVAGIIGANGTGDAGVTGVATQVTFGAYRIFGCQGSTDTDMILKALTRAKKDGMNVINLSLGGVFDSWSSYPDAVAASNLVKAGVVVVASAGNRGDAGLFSAGGPAVGSGVISVASYEPAKMRSRAIEVDGAKYPYSQVDWTATAPTAGSLTLRVASNVTACTTPAPVAAGTALLVKRGDCLVRDKVLSAQAAGAAAVIVYNSEPGLGSFTVHNSDADTALPVPAISISGTDGENLAGHDGSTFTWLDFEEDNPDGGVLSDFSSAGLAADLSLIPTITAPGGKIYSTLPIERGTHGNMSGTSMAAPYVTGSVAVMLQVKPSLKKHPSSVAQLLYNTADLVSEATETAGSDSLASRAEAVFRQGSGRINLEAALGATVTASPSVLKLGEGDSHKVTISLTNKSKTTQIYTPTAISGVSAAASVGTGSSVGTTTPDYAYGDVGFAAPASVKVKAGKTVRVKVTITAPTNVLTGRPGLLYGGWVKFTAAGAGNTVSVPFAGMRGDYQAVKLLNGFEVQTSPTESQALPTLAYMDEGYLYAQGDAGREYSMYTDGNSSDIPIVLYHLDYPASDVQMKVTDTETGKSYDAIVNWEYVTSKGKVTSSRAIHLGKQSRDDSFQELKYWGAIYYKGKGYSLPSGTYTLTLRVQKPLGTASKSSHWETFTTPEFSISW